MFANRLAAALPRDDIAIDQVSVPPNLTRLAYWVSAGSAKHVQASASSATTWRQARARIGGAHCLYVKNDLLDLAVARLLAFDKPLVIGMHSSLDIPQVDMRTGLRRFLRRSLLYKKLLVGRRRLYHCLYTPPATWQLPPAQVRVVPHPIEHHRSAARLSSQQQQFLFVGRLNRDKGADLLCGLARRLSAEHGVELVVVGDGEYAAAIGKEPGLHYYRYRRDIRLLMRRATWLLMPSRWEQQPLVLLESLEEGLPYILGPATEIQRFGLDSRLMMPAATVDALHECCLAAIHYGRVQSEYQRFVHSVSELANGWPNRDQTTRSMVSLLTEAAGLER